MRPVGKSSGKPPNPKAKKTPKKSQPQKAQETTAKKVGPPKPTVNDSEDSEESDIFFTPRSKQQQPAQPTVPVKEVPLKGAAKRKKGPVKRTPPYINQMIHLQKTVEPQIPRSCFMRLVREIMQNCSSENLRLTAQALEALRESAEMYIVQALGDAYLITTSRNQVTLQARDLQLLVLLRGR